MSYRTIKRVLGGETSLERKCRLLFGACLLVLIFGSFWWYGHITEEQQTYKPIRRYGHGAVTAFVMAQHWERFAEAENEKSWVRGFVADMQAKNATCSTIKPNFKDGGGRPQDEFEYAVLEKFNHIVPPPNDGEIAEIEYAERRQPESKKYLYYEPIRYKRDCFTCHWEAGKPANPLTDGSLAGPEPYREGELIAVVKVVMDFPDAETQKAMNWNRALLFTMAIITVFVSMIALWIIVRYVIVKPLKHLTEVSDAITRGDLDQRAEIHTGDEFEELGVAFNRMLRHLVEAQQELRQVNTDLDGKIDELAQMNMRLYDMNRLKGDFLATISHELRTPLNSILGFSDVLGSIDSLNDKQKRYVVNIRESGQVLLEMINDILDLAKLESGKADVRLTDVKIATLIGAHCDMARPLTEKKNIDLDIVVPDDLPPMLQDQGKIQQILNNLLSNAIKFTPEGGRIVVDARRMDNGELLLQVTDTGVGIAEEDQVAVFEKFRQGNTVLPGGDAMTREYSGTGLGLSIVKELCKLLDGSISLKSQLGQGSTFTVRLPWKLQERPKLDSPLDEQLDELTRPKLHSRDQSAAIVAHGTLHRGSAANGAADGTAAEPRAAAGDPDPLER
ncbi:MAG: HAMP domain-containing protein [Planctomycetes bacterium]|nr:HAMP domain-containing protein [Planctomycetota bacterium]